ncbi:hypothetical protein FKP32DRAFT_1539582, partial [Trametes sanguinea]
PETGRPETAREFAKRIRRVILHPPREQRQEGAAASESTPAHSLDHLEAPRIPELEGASPERVQSPIGLDEASSSTLLEHIASADGGIHLETVIKGRYDEDPFFRPILANPRQYKNFEVKDEMIYLRDQGRELICVPRILVNGRSVREIAIAHAHSLLAHLGATKTMNLLRDHLWWK